ncbi:MAG: 4-phosphoerythronate dehydrogenase [Alistipes sp.]|nr:4-phosphoerythronate dehydrogenase [Alistipes sp.]
MHYIIDSDIPFIRGVLEPYGDVCYIKGGNITRDVLGDADVLVVRTRTRCDEELLSGSKVKFIATATIGMDHIDLDYCKRQGIEVINAKGCNARGVLQWVAAVLREVVLTNGGKPSDYRLGVVGIGCVGSLVVEYARHWGFEVLMCDPPRKEREGGDFRSVEELAKCCDILTFHTPYDASTHHLVGEYLLGLMQPNAVILNASRGGVVDNRAVADSSHRYYFDVWENEPNIEPDILSKSSMATPHVAGYSLQGKANATSMVVNAIARRFSLPLVGWYPIEVVPTNVQLISWKEMCSSIENYYPISEESLYLKLHPEEFEKMRNSYVYRVEYF